MFATFPLVGFQIVTVGFLMALGQARKAILLSLSRQLLCLVPLLILLPPRFGADGVWVSMPIADTVSLIAAAFMDAHQLKLIKRGAAAN